MEDHSSEKCPICLEPFTDSSDTEPDLEKTACEHVFHRQCLSEWFRIGVPGNYCPLCKQEVLEKEAASLSDSSDYEETSEEETDSEEYQQLQHQSIEDIGQSVLENFLEVEQSFVRMQNSFNVMNDTIVRSQDAISNIPRPLLGMEQQQVDEFSRILSSAKESLNMAQEKASEALEILVQIRQRDSVTLDWVAVRQEVAVFKDLYSNVQQQVSRTSELLEDLEEVVDGNRNQSTDAIDRE